MKMYVAPLMTVENLSPDTSISSGGSVCAGCAIPSGYTENYVCAPTDSRGQQGVIKLDSSSKTAYHCYATKPYCN